MAAEWWVETGIEGATFLVPDVYFGDAQGNRFTFFEVEVFYDLFRERFGVTFLDASAKITLLTSGQKSAHLDVKRKDLYTYEFTVRIGRFRP